MNNRTIARLQIPAKALPASPCPTRRPCPEPTSWPLRPLLQRPINKTSILHPSSFSSISCLGWEQHLLPSTHSRPTSHLTPMEGYARQIFPSPHSLETISLPNPSPQSSVKTEWNDSEGVRIEYSPDSKGYYCGSILKKQDFANGYSKDGTRRQLQPGARRNVAFKNSVSVYWYDSEAESSCSPTDCEHFNLQSRDRHLFAEENTKGTASGELCPESGTLRTYSKKRLESSCAGNALNFRGCTPTVLPGGSPVGVQQKQTILSQLIPDNHKSFLATPCGFTSGHCVHFSLVQDQVSFGRKLVVAVQLSPELCPYQVLVKANKNGNKIRVVISKDTSPGNGTGHVAKELISLPVEVDPYQLNARLDRGGTLHVEAPIVS